jgi:hypothetical protein
MSKKDYVLIASAISESRVFAGSDDKNGITLATFSIADKLQRENPRFDRGRFLTACGVESILNS